MSQVQVCVRVRPLNETELENEHGTIVHLPPSPKGSLFLQKPVKYLSIAEQQDKIRKREVGSTFSFDRVFDSSNTHSPNYATQHDVFDYIGKKVVDTAFNAFNCTVFAYGQTGSGKTFTLMGSHVEGSEDRGIVPRTCEYLFREIMQRNEQSPDDAFSRYKVEISFLEIYNEKVRDLLLRQPAQPVETGSRPNSAKKSKTTLRVREHPKEGVIVEGLSRHIVNDYEAVEELIKKGNAIRISGATHMHEHSSRSHAIFTIHFVQAEMSDDGVPSEKVSKINLVDLAGSERADPASDYNRERFKEGININQSLVSLGNVIDALAEISQQSTSRPATAASSRSGASQQPPSIHIPYRASILTFLLRDSLGGNAFTTMIATISPSSSSYNETVSTLRYASRTQVIQNKPVKNEDPQIRLIKDLKNEVDRLKKMLGNKGALGGVSQVLEQKVTQGQEEIDNLTKQWTAQWDRQKLLLQDSVTHDATGLTVNSDFPHLVGFPNATSRNKAFVVYQLYDGAFTIGSGDHEIGVFGTPSNEVQGVIKNENGVVTLVPYKPNQFQINSIDISGKAVLYSGCLVQLGPANIFRFWDPTVHKPAAANKGDECGQEGLLTDSANSLREGVNDDGDRLQMPEFTRLRGLDRSSSMMSFQSVDMEGSFSEGRHSEKTQSMVSLLSNQEVIDKMALADSLAEQLNEAHQTIQSLQEAKQHKDEEEEEKRMALDDLQFSYQEQICEHQDKIEELLRNNETATENAEAEMAHLQQKYDEKMRKEKASLDEEILKLDKLMNQIYVKKKTAKTTMARSNLEKEEIEIMGKLKNLKEREKKLKESLRSIENQIREKEKKLAAKKKKFEEKLQKMETELHSIKAQYLDKHMRTWSSNRPTVLSNISRSTGNLIGSSTKDPNFPEFDKDEEQNRKEEVEKTMEIEGEIVKLRSKPGRSATLDKKGGASAGQFQSGVKPTFSQLLERRRKEREAAGEKYGIGDRQKQQQSNMVNISIGEDDEGNPMYLKISLKGSGDVVEDPDQSSASNKDQKSPSNRSRSLAKERALSMDLADLCKLTTFQEITLKEPQLYESGDNLLTDLPPSECGRNIMLQRFMNDLGRASVSDVRSNFGYSQEKLVASTSEINLKIERHCEAGVQVVSPSSSCDTLVLEKAVKAKVVYHEVKLRVESHLHIREPLNIANGVKVVSGARTRSVSDYESVSTATRATSPTTQISGDSLLATKSVEDDKKVMRRIINGPNVFRPVSQNITAYPVSRDGRDSNRDNNAPRRPRPKSMNLEPEFNEENEENEWDFRPITRSSSGAIRKPFEIKQTEGHTARIGPKVMLTVTPPVTVTAIPGHMLSERPHLIPKTSNDSHPPSGSSKFLKMRRDLQSRQKPKVTENSPSSVRSDPRAFSVISSREDLREANSMQLKQRLYSNQPFLAESAIFNDFRGEPEARPNSTAQPRVVRTSRTFNIERNASRENDLEVAQYTEEESSSILPSASGSHQVRRRLNPNKTKMFEEKRMSWPVNKQEQLTAEMESQPLFIKDYHYTSEDSVFKTGSEFAAYEGLFDPENIPEQTENSSTCEEDEPTYYLDKFQRVSEFRNSETIEEVVYTQQVKTNDPPMVYQMPNYDFRGTETEEILEDENYSMGIYIETKSLTVNEESKDIKREVPKKARPQNLSADYFKFPSPTRERASSFTRLESSRDASKISRTPSEVLSNSRSYLASESGAYRHVEETFTTESVVTKGHEKRTKSGRIIGKWKLVKKKEKNMKEKENYLSTIEVPLNVPQSTPKKIKFDKTLSNSATSINSLKKMRNQGSSPIEFLKESTKVHNQSMQSREERHHEMNSSKLKLKNAKSLSRLKLQSESFQKYPESPKTPSSSIATQTACEISTQTPTSLEMKSPKTKNSQELKKVSERRSVKVQSLTHSSYTRTMGQSKSSLKGGKRSAQYKVKGIKRISDDQGSEKISSSDESMRRKKLKHETRRGSKSKQGAFDAAEKQRKIKKRKYKRRGRYSGSSHSSSPFSSDSEPRKTWGHHAKKKLRDATTNTVNEIGIQTEEKLEPLSIGTNTCVEDETQTYQELNVELQCDTQLLSSPLLTLREKIPSCESVQTLTFKSSPAFYSETQNRSKIMPPERPVSLENLFTPGTSERNRFSANRKTSSNPAHEAKRKVLEFMKSCPSNKVEEYLQLLHAAGVSAPTLQGFLKAIQNSQPLEIPSEVMQYFETSSMVGTENQYPSNVKPVDTKRTPLESLMNMLTFAPFPASLHIANEYLKGVADISEADKKQILDCILKQDSANIPANIDDKYYVGLENAIGSACNDDFIVDTDTTSVLESENISNSDMKHSRCSSNAPGQLSPFGSLTIPDAERDDQGEQNGDFDTIETKRPRSDTRPKIGQLGRTPGATSSFENPNIQTPDFMFDESYNLPGRVSRGFASSPYEHDRTNASSVGSYGQVPISRQRHKSAEANARDYNMAESEPLKNRQIMTLTPGFKPHLRSSTPRGSTPASGGPNQSATFSSRSTTGSNIPSLDDNEVSRQTPSDANASGDQNQHRVSPKRLTPEQKGPHETSTAEGQVGKSDPILIQNPPNQTQSLSFSTPITETWHHVYIQGVNNAENFNSLPLNLRDTIAAQILINLSPEIRRQLLTAAGAAQNNIAMVEMVVQKGNPEEVCEAVSTLIGDSTVELVLSQTGKDDCMRAVSQVIAVQNTTNEDITTETASATAFSDEPKSEESITQIFNPRNSTEVHGLVVVASRILMTLNRAERNYWLEKLGLYDVVKNEIKEAIEKGDFEKLKKILPEESAKFLIENVQPMKVKEGIASVLKEPSNPLSGKFGDVVIKTLLEDPPEMVTEILSSTSTHSKAEVAIVEAVSNKDSAKLKMLLSNEIIETFVAEMSSDVLIETLTSVGKQATSPRSALEFTADDSDLSGLESNLSSSIRKFSLLTTQTRLDQSQNLDNNFDNISRFPRDGSQNMQTGGRFTDLKTGSSFETSQNEENQPVTGSENQDLNPEINHEPETTDETQLQREASSKSFRKGPEGDIRNARDDTHEPQATKEKAAPHYLKPKPGATTRRRFLIEEDTLESMEDRLGDSPMTEKINAKPDEPNEQISFPSNETSPGYVDEDVLEATVRKIPRISGLQSDPYSNYFSNSGTDSYFEQIPRNDAKMIPGQSERIRKLLDDEILLSDFDDSVEIQDQVVENLVSQNRPTSRKNFHHDDDPRKGAFPLSMSPHDVAMAVDESTSDRNFDEREHFHKLSTTSTKSEMAPNEPWQPDKGQILSAGRFPEVPYGSKLDERFDTLSMTEDTPQKELEALVEEAEENDQPKNSDPASLTPQKIIASVILDLDGEEILGLISDLDPLMQNDILDAVIGRDIVKITQLTDEQTANEMLGSIDPFEMANVIDKAQERFEHPEKMLQPQKIEDVNELLRNLDNAYRKDTAVLKDILARMDIEIAPKIYEALAEDDLIAAKALLYSATVEDMPALNKKHAFSDSALAKQKAPLKLSKNLTSLSKSESELARKPEGNKSVSEEVLGEFYDQALHVSDAKVVYVDMPVPESPRYVSPGDQLMDTYVHGDGDVEIPQELFTILSKYVEPEKVIDLYNDFLHNPDSVAERFPREIVESLFNDVEAFELEEHEKTVAVHTIAANTLQSLSEQEEMDDLVMKLQELIPNDVSEFCHHVNNGDFIEAAKFLPAEILDEMMEERRHNLSYTNDPVVLSNEQTVDDSSHASSRPTVPVIEEENEEEEESSYENVKALGILKKDEQSNSIKNLQVKFDPQVYEFDLTNHSVLDCSSKESSFLGDPTKDHSNDNFEDTSIDEALYKLRNSADLQDLTAKIAALEAKMDTIEVSEAFDVETDTNWYENLVSIMGPPEERFVNEILTPNKSSSLDEEKGDSVPIKDLVRKRSVMDVEAGQEREIDWEEFVEEMRRWDDCSDNSSQSEQRSIDSDRNEKNTELLKEIENWEREEKQKLKKSTKTKKSDKKSRDKNKDDKRVRDNQSRASNQQKDTKIERNSKSSNSFKDNTTTKIENSSEDSRKDTTSTLIGSIIDEFQNLDGLLSKSDTSLKDSRRKQRQKDDCETEQSTSDKSFENSEPFSEENRTFVPKDSVGSKNNNNSDLDKASNSSSEKTIKEKSSIGKKYDVDSNELDENEMQPRSRSYSGEDGFPVGPQSKRPRNESSLDATEPEKLLPKQQGRGSQSEEYDEMEATTQSSDDKSGPRNSEVKQPRSSDDPASVNGSRRSSNRSSDGDLIEETNLEDPLEQAKQLSQVPTKNGKIEPLKKPHDDLSLKSKGNGLNDDVFGFGPDQPENKETDEIMKSDRPSAMNEGLANPKTCQGRNDEDPKRDPPKVDERLLQDANQHRGYDPNKNGYDASEDDNKCDPREGENRQGESKDPRLVSRGKKYPGLSTSLDTSREKNRSEEPNDEMFDNSLSLSCGESSIPSFEDDGHRELQTSELKDDSCLMNEDPENEDPGSTATMEKASEPNLDPKFSSMDQAFDGSSYGMKHDAEKDPSQDPKFFTLDQSFDESSDDDKPKERRDPSQDTNFPGLRQVLDGSIDDEKPDERRNPSQDPKFSGSDQSSDGSSDDEKPEERRSPSQDPKVSGLEQAFDGSSNDRSSDDGSSDDGSSDDQKPGERRDKSQDPKPSGLEQALDRKNNDEKPDERRDQSQDPKFSGSDQSSDGSNDDEKPDERRDPSQDPKFLTLDQSFDESSDDEEPEERRDPSQDTNFPGLRQALDGSIDDEKPDERRNPIQDPKFASLDQAFDGSSEDEKPEERRSPSQDPKISGLEQALDGSSNDRSSDEGSSDEGSSDEGSSDDEKPDERRSPSQDPKVSGLEQALDGSSTDTSSDEGSSDDEKPDERRSPSQDLKVSGLEQALDGSSNDRMSDNGSSEDEKPDERRDTSQDPKLSGLEQALDGKSSDEKLDKRRHPSQDPKFSGLEQALDGSIDDEKPDERRNPSQDPKVSGLEQALDGSSTDTSSDEGSSDDEKPDERRRRRSPSQDLKVSGLEQALDGSSIDRSSDEGNSDDEKPDERRDSSQDPKLSGLEQALDGKSSDEKLDKRRHPGQDPKFSGLEQALAGSSDDEKPDERRDPSQDPKFFTLDQSFDESSDDEEPEERRDPSQDTNFPSSRQALDGSINDEKPGGRRNPSQDPKVSDSDQSSDGSSNDEKPEEKRSPSQDPKVSGLEQAFDGSSNDRSSDEGNTDDEKPDERRDTSQDPKLSGLEQALDGRNNDKKPDKRRDPCQDPKFSGLEQALDGSSNDAKPDERRDQSQDPKFSGSDQSSDGSSDDEKPEERRSPSQDPKVSSLDQAFVGSSDDGSSDDEKPDERRDLSQDPNFSSLDQASDGSSDDEKPEERRSPSQDPKFSSLDQAFDGRRDDGSKGDRSSNDEKPDIREDVSEDPIFSGSDQYCDESSDYEEPNENVEVEKPNISNLRSTFLNDEMETKCSPMNGNDSTTMTSAESGGEVPDDRETPSKSSCDPNAKDDAVNTNTTVSELEDSPLENLNTSLSTESDDEAKENEIPVKPAGIKIDSLSCTDEEASPFESQETSSVPSAYRDSPTIPGFESVPKSDDEPEKTSLMEKFEENSVLEGPERLNTDPKIENGSTSPKKSEPMNEDLKNNRRPDNKKRKISEDDDLPETSQDGAMKANEETPLESICLSPGGRTNPKIVDQLRNSEREAPTEDLNRTNRTPSEDNPQFPQYNEVFSDAPSSDWENVLNKMDDPQNILTGAVPQTNSDDEKKIPEGTPTDLDKPQSSDYQEEFEPLEQQSEVLSLDEKQIAVKTRVEPEHPKNLLKKHETLPCIVDKQAGLLEEAAVDNFGEDSDEDTIGEDARTDVTNKEDTDQKPNRISDDVTPGSSQEVPIDEEKSDNDPPSDIKPQNTETKSDDEKPHLPYPANQENDSKKRKLPQIPGDETKPDEIHVLKKESDSVYKPESLDRREEDPDEMLEPFDKNKPVDDSEPPHVFEEPISKGIRTFDQNYPVLHELQPPQDIDKSKEKPNDSQNYLPGIGEPKFEEENEENLPPGSEDEIADHEEPPRYVSPEELRNFLHDLWPEGKVPDDNGYITVQEVDARSYAVFKPESVDSINSPEFESVEKLDDPLEESDTNTSPIKSALDSGLSLHDALNFVDNVQPKNDLSTKDKPKNNQDSSESVLDETSDDTKIAPRKEEPYNQEKLIEPIHASQPELHEKPDRKFTQSDPNEEHSGTAVVQQPDIVKDIDPETQTSTGQVSPKNLEPGHPTSQFAPVYFDPRSTPFNTETNAEPLDDEFTLNDLPTDPRRDEEKIEAQEKPKRKLPEMPNEQISEMPSNPYLSEQNNSPKDSTNKPIDNFATNIPSKISAPVDTFPQNTFLQQTNVGSGNTPQDTSNQSNHPAKSSKRMLPQIPNTQTDISPLSQKLESSQPNCLGRSDPSEEPNSLQYSDPVEPVGERYDIPELDQQLEHVQTAAPCRENNDQKFDDPEVELNELDQSKNDDDEYFFISLPSDCDDETLDQIQQYLMDPETLWKLINGETPVVEVGDDVNLDNLFPVDENNCEDDDVNLDDTNYLNKVAEDIDKYFENIEPSDSQALVPKNQKPVSNPQNLKPEISKEEPSRKLAGFPKPNTDENNNALKQYQDRGVQPFLNDGLSLPLQSDVFMTQFNINIDVKISSSEDLSSSEHVQRSGYNSHQSPSSERPVLNSLKPLDLKSPSNDYRKTIETQTINFDGQHNELLEAISDDEHIDIIEYKYLPGVRTDATVEELELLCSKAVGKVNGLLNIVDQISPPHSPIFQNPAVNNNYSSPSSALPKKEPLTIFKQPAYRTSEITYPGLSMTRKRASDPVSDVIGNRPRSPSSTLKKYRAILQNRREEHNSFTDRNPIDRNENFLGANQTAGEKSTNVHSNYPNFARMGVTNAPLNDGQNFVYRSDAVFNFDRFNPEKELHDDVLKDLDSTLLSRLNHGNNFKTNHEMENFQPRRHSLKNNFKPIDHSMFSSAREPITEFSKNHGKSSESIFATPQHMLAPYPKRVFKIPLPNRTNDESNKLLKTTMQTQNVNIPRSKPIIKWNSHFNLSQPKNISSKPNFAPQSYDSSSTGYFQADAETNQAETEEFPYLGTVPATSSLSNLPKVFAKSELNPQGLTDFNPRVSLTYARHPAGPTVSFKKPLQTRLNFANTVQPFEEPRQNGAYNHNNPGVLHRQIPYEPGNMLHRNTSNNPGLTQRHRSDYPRNPGIQVHTCNTNSNPRGHSKGVPSYNPYLYRSPTHICGPKQVLSSHSDCIRPTEHTPTDTSTSSGDESCDPRCPLCVAEEEEMAGKNKTKEEECLLCVAERVRSCFQEAVCTCSVESPDESSHCLVCDLEELTHF